MPDRDKKGKALFPEPIHDEDAAGLSTGYAHALAQTLQAKPPDYARGSILRVILRMGLPSVIGFLAVNLYDLADMFWLARLGAQYVAAIALFEGFYWVLIFTNEIAGLGSIAVISRRYGETDLTAAAAAIKETFILKWLCALFSGSLGYIFLKPLMRLMGASEEVAELGVQFGRVHMIGMGIFFSSYTVFTSLRCIEAPRTAMVVMLMGSFLNIVLDPLFIFGIGPFPKLGISGAAVASVISYAITFFIGLYIFFSGRAPVRLRWSGQAPVSLKNMLNMMKIGLPGGINTISFSLSRAAVLPLVAIFGTNVVAAYGMGLRITQVGILMVWGFGVGISPLVGNLLGAGLKERVWQTARQSMILSLAVVSALSLLTFALAPQIVQVFFKNNDLLVIAVELLRIYCLALPPIAIWIVAESLFHGAGDNVPPMLISIVTSWVVEIPLVLLFTRLLGFDQTAIWWIRVVYALSGALASLYLVRRGRWLNKGI